MSSSKGCIVLHFTLSSVMHFELVFVKDIRSESRLTFPFAFGCPVFPALLIEKTVISPLHCHCSFVKDKLTISGLPVLFTILLFFKFFMLFRMVFPL